MVSYSFVLYPILIFNVFVSPIAKGVKFDDMVQEFLEEVQELDRMIDGDGKKPQNEIDSEIPNTGTTVELPSDPGGGPETTTVGTRI